MPDGLHLEERDDPLRALTPRVVRPVETCVGDASGSSGDPLDVLGRGDLDRLLEVGRDAPCVEGIDVGVRRQDRDELALEAGEDVDDAARDV